MTRTLLGCLVALCVGFVSGCTGGGESQVVEQEPITMEEQLKLDEAYESEMAEGDGEGDE